MYTVYQHKNKINGKVYIGITSQIPTQRWGANGKNYRSSPHPNMKMIYCEETNTIYKSVQECARQLDIYATNISKVCQGKIKTTKGYHLRYYNDTINA